jgi:hypothetical protein
MTLIDQLRERQKQLVELIGLANRDAEKSLKLAEQYRKELIAVGRGLIRLQAKLRARGLIQPGRSLQH